METLNFLYLSYNISEYNNLQFNYWKKQIEIIICNKIVGMDDENPFIKIYVNNRKIVLSAR
jgi:hypothetical protein